MHTYDHVLQTKNIYYNPVPITNNSMKDLKIRITELQTKKKGIKIISLCQNQHTGSLQTLSNKGMFVILRV
jgi:hypothetical protein